MDPSSVHAILLVNCKRCSKSRKSERLESHWSLLTFKEKTHWSVEIAGGERDCPAFGSEVRKTTWKPEHGQHCGENLPALGTIRYARDLKSTYKCSQNPIILNINYWSIVETFSTGTEKASTRDDSRRLRCHVSAGWSGQFLWTRASSNINSTCPLQAGCWNVVHFYSG
jgi:hypothetical protein